METIRYQAGAFFYAALCGTFVLLMLSGPLAVAGGGAQKSSVTQSEGTRIVFTIKNVRTLNGAPWYTMARWQYEVRSQSATEGDDFNVVTGGGVDDTHITFNTDDTKDFVIETIWEKDCASEGTETFQIRFFNLETLPYPGTYNSYDRWITWSPPSAPSAGHATSHLGPRQFTVTGKIKDYIDNATYEACFGGWS